MFSKLKKDRRAITGAVMALIVLFVAVGVMIPVGILATAKIENTMEAMYNDMGEEGNATAIALFSNIYSAYSLTSIVPIVAGAGLIIGIIIVSLTIYGRKKGGGY
jgi:hypothetical protein